ncbi:MAG TPA: hypothetical protein VKD08_09280 [Ignavibacteriaceae bacterium]|nr:hypothetical protein [Ignavibacteriaceae bacterium]
MKALLTVLFLIALFISLDFTAYAQPAQGNVFVMTRFERAFPENGSASELDSLTQIMMDNSYKNNPFVVSYKTVRHWWGHDNRDFMQIIEVKSWDDVDKASEEANTQFMKAMPNKADRDSFGKAYDKYFTGKHSDEIYREVVFKK